jgi:AAA+ ATPase superfamily predicted ATPase
MYFVADESSATFQRRFFADAAQDRFPGFAEVDYPDWGALLRRLSTQAQEADWRGPLVIDELPYLVESARELPSILQRWIDHDARAARLVVVLAGSSQRMMQGLTLDPNAPLYGRARELLPLAPLSPSWIPRAFPGMSSRQAIETYAVWGGIPRYWELAEGLRTSNLEEQLDRLVLEPTSPLHREPERLLREEQPPATALRPILDAIGMGCHRLSEIAARVGRPATSMHRPLQRLIELDLIVRELPFGESEKSQKRSLYRLNDPFFRLWFRIVSPHRSALAQSSEAVRIGLWRRHRDVLTSQTWEALCRRSVPLVRRGHVQRHGPWAPAQRYWHGSGPEWDVVSRSLDGRYLLLGEAKWLTGPTTMARVRQAAEALQQKGLPPFLQPGAQVHRVIFVPARPRGRLPDGVELLDASDVLAALRHL